MNEPVAFLITYANGHSVVQSGADVLDQTSYSVTIGSASRRDLGGGAFELTSTEDGRTRRYEPVTTEAPGAARFQELLSDDGLDWESVGIVPSSHAERVCARQVARGFASLWYLASGSMVLIDTTRRRQALRYEPVGEHR